METRNATVTKTPFNSYNVVTCTMKELLSVSLSLHSKLIFFLFGVSPPFPLPAVSSTRIVGLKEELIS